MFICVRHGDNQRFLANADCPVLLLLPYVRRKAAVPAGVVIDLCDALGTPKLLFQAKAQSERASKFFPTPGPYYVCRVEFGAPGTAHEHTYQALVPLLKEPSAELTGRGKASGRAEDDGGPQQRKAAPAARTKQEPGRKDRHR
ncbi:uncharacterized protein CXorf65 homolog [Nothoprocta perdicaria]|uniref:uncharacterized protein CXorf65 homolog n=1 Tax=Nothoprocta perdicaria TaxID=30464 RepID=UPI000E1BD23A|nr:uncharacterized protein CXorf65 homolog [Nothoprocta perdicaria]